MGCLSVLTETDVLAFAFPPYPISRRSTSGRMATGPATAVFAQIRMEPKLFARIGPGYRQLSGIPTPWVKAIVFEAMTQKRPLVGRRPSKLPAPSAALWAHAAVTPFWTRAGAPHQSQPKTAVHVAEDIRTRRPPRNTWCPTRQRKPASKTNDVAGDRNQHRDPCSAKRSSRRPENWSPAVPTPMALSRGIQKASTWSPPKSPKMATPIREGSKSDISKSPRSPGNKRPGKFGGRPSPTPSPKSAKKTGRHHRRRRSLEMKPFVRRRPKACKVRSLGSLPHFR